MMQSLIALFITSIVISSSCYAFAEELIVSLIEDSEYDLARLKLYEQYYRADSIASQQFLPIIGFTYQMEGNLHKAKKIYEESIQNSSSLSDDYSDSIKVNLSYVYMELHEYGNAFGLINSIKSELVLPVKRMFHILTLERGYLLDTNFFSEEEINTIGKFSAELRNPRLARLLSTFIPGAGQLYSLHHIDGLQAIMVVGAGILYSSVAYNAYSNNQIGAGLPAITIGVTGLFHYANILSGFRTAVYRNIKLKRDFINSGYFDFSPLDLSTRLSRNLTVDNFGTP